MKKDDKLSNFIEQLKKIDFLMQKLDTYRPYSIEAINKVWLDEDIEYIYNSEAVEGNTLTLRETYLVLKDGVTVGQKPIGYLLDTVNHKGAYEFMLNFIEDGEKYKDYTLEDVVLKLHEILRPHGLKEFECGNYRYDEVRIKGSTHIPPEAKEIENLMKNFLSKVENENNSIIKACDLHFYITEVHPFFDGNGRVARLTLNLMLRKDGYLPFLLKLEDRETYNQALENSSLNNPNPFREWFVNKYLNDLELKVEKLEKYLQNQQKAIKKFTIKTELKNASN